MTIPKHNYSTNVQNCQSEVILRSTAIVGATMPVAAWLIIHDLATAAGYVEIARRIDAALAEREGRMVQLSLGLMATVYNPQETISGGK